MNVLVCVCVFVFHNLLYSWWYVLSGFIDCVVFCVPYVLASSLIPYSAPDDDIKGQSTIEKKNRVAEETRWYTLLRM